MGTKCAPNYANIFMGVFEEKHIYPFINQCSTIYLHFIDDIFMIWKGSKEQLDNFIKDLNEKHATIKFELKYRRNKSTFLTQQSTLRKIKNSKRKL